jgi:hypothetical protein
MGYIRVCSGYALKHQTRVKLDGSAKYLSLGILKGGSITVPLTTCLTGLD